MPNKQIAVCLVPFTFKSEMVSISHKHDKTAFVVASCFPSIVNKVPSLELK